jgi:hypothetical protein
VAQRCIPPLRERPDDITLLVEQFAELMRRKHGLQSVRFTPAAMDALRRYAWPGNAREVRNAIETALLCAGDTIDLDCLPPELTQAPPPAAPPAPDLPQHAADGMAAVRNYERQLIVGMLRKYRNVSQVAHALGLARSTLYRKFAELGIQQAEVLGGDEGPAVLRPAAAVPLPGQPVRTPSTRPLSPTFSGARFCAVFDQSAPGKPRRPRWPGACAGGICRGRRPPASTIPQRT